MDPGKKQIGNIVLIVLFLIVLTQFVWASVTRLSQGPAQDFEVFWLSGRQVLAGNNPYIKLGGDIVRNPPPAMLFFALLGLLPIHAAEVSYFIVSFGAFLVASFFLFKTIEDNLFSISTPGEGIRPLPECPRQTFNMWQGKIIYLTLALRFFPFRHNLASGQVNNFLLLLLVLAFYFLLKNRTFWSALMIALAIGLKITPLIFIPLFLAQGRLKTALLTVAQTISLLLLTTVILGQKIWQNYATLTSSFFDLGISRYYNQSIVGFLNRINPSLTKPIYLILLIGVFLAFLFLALHLKTKSLQASLISWNLTILTTLLFAPFAWQYHFTIAIFPLFTSAWLALKQKSPILPLIIVGFSYLLLAGNLKNTVFFNEWGILGTFIVSHAVFGTLILSLLNLHFLTLDFDTLKYRRKSKN